MKYQNYNYENKLDIEKVLNSSNRDEKIKILVGMTNGIDDWLWLQEKFLELINDNDFWIAKNAITGLGDVARVHNKLDVEKVVKALKDLNRTELEDVVKETIDDIEIFTNNPLE